METRKLGRTGLTVSRLGLGLAALGRPGYITLGHGRDLPSSREVAAMEAHAHAVLDVAWQAGIRYIDAARSYGRAEAFLASWLGRRGMRPEALTVGSKWGYTYTAGWQVRLEPGLQHEVKEHSQEVLQRQVEESRGHLGAHLDLYQIHSATRESGVLENRRVLETLARLRDEGLAIGFSVSGSDQAETILRGIEIEIGGQPLFSCVQATWNLLEPSAADALHLAHGAGVGVIIKEALANGRLTPRNDDPAFEPGLERLRAAARERETSVDALSLAAALAQPWADVVLSGAASPQHLAANLGALQLRWDDDLARPLQALAESPADYWRTRGKLPWN